MLSASFGAVYALITLTACSGALTITWVALVLFRRRKAARIFAVMASTSLLLLLLVYGEMYGFTWFGWTTRWPLPGHGFRQRLFSPVKQFWAVLNMRGAQISSTKAQQPGAYSFAKDKLPRALSFPLKRSLLDAALHSSSVYQTVWYVLYSRTKFERVVLQAHFTPESSGSLLSWASGKVQITVHAVPATERKLTEDMLLNEGLPMLCRWLAKAESEGNAWRSLVHLFTIEQTDGGLKFSDE
jgi:hypothetical protein